MLHRISNGTRDAAERDTYLAALRRAATDPVVDEGTCEEIKHFLQLKLIGNVSIPLRPVLAPAEETNATLDLNKTSSHPHLSRCGLVTLNGAPNRRQGS